jgi:hypothetical protein
MYITYHVSSNVYMCVNTIENPLVLRSSTASTNPWDVLAYIYRAPIVLVSNADKTELAHSYHAGSDKGQRYRLADLDKAVSRIHGHRR